jgi:hypothetical protein
MEMERGKDGRVRQAGVTDNNFRINWIMKRAMYRGRWQRR